MSSLETARCDTVRRLFTAYVAQHPDLVDPMLAPISPFPARGTITSTGNNISSIAGRRRRCFAIFTSNI